MRETSRYRDEKHKWKRDKCSRSRVETLLRHRLRRVIKLGAVLLANDADYVTVNGLP